MKKIIFLFFVFVLLTIGLAFYSFQFLTQTTPHTIEITIPRGTSVKGVSEILQKENAISNALLFEALVRLTKKGSKIKAGDYELESDLTPIALLNILIEGRVKMKPLTIPEGYNLEQIGKVLMEQKLVTREEWTKLVKDPLLLSQAQTTFETLEGYLYPDTYMLDKQITGQKLIGAMIANFKKHVTSDLIAEAKSKELNLHQWVTLASIIEKETGMASERPLIAAVFINRLKQGMLLQTDPTVIYGIANYTGNITRADLEKDTPYNTYTRPGLPPGPICSPGIESLLAVLRPAQADALYFVAKGDGGHYFSKTLEEHNQAVNFFQRKIGEEPRPAN